MILLVGGDGSARSRLKGSLTGHGFVVVESATPQAALGLTKEAMFDGVLVHDEARQLALRGLCTQLSKSNPDTRVFVLLTPASDRTQILSAAGGAATLVPPDTSLDQIAALLSESFSPPDPTPIATPMLRTGSDATPIAVTAHAPAVDPEAPTRLDHRAISAINPATLTRGPLLDRGKLWELHLVQRGGREEMLWELSPAAPRDAELDAALLRAATLWRRIEHPNVPRVTGVFGGNERPWLLLEHDRGETLHHLRRKLYDLDRWFHPATAAWIVHELLAGLEAIHDAKLSHGALGPHALWITTSGRVLVLHVGTGSVLRSAERAMKGSLRSLGVPDPYLAPEQITDGITDSKSDLFLAGTLLYELLSGDPLFLRDDATHTADAIVACEVPDLERSVAPSLVAVMKSLLERDPDRRPRSAAAARAALEAAIEAAKHESSRGLLGKLFGKKNSRGGAVDPRSELIELASLPQTGG